MCSLELFTFYWKTFFVKTFFHRNNQKCQKCAKLPKAVLKIILLTSFFLPKGFFLSIEMHFEIYFQKKIGATLWSLLSNKIAQNFKRLTNTNCLKFWVQNESQGWNV